MTTYHTLTIAPTGECTVFTTSDDREVCAHVDAAIPAGFRNYHATHNHRCHWHYEGLNAPVNNVARHALDVLEPDVATPNVCGTVCVTTNNSALFDKLRRVVDAPAMSK